MSHSVPVDAQVADLVSQRRVGRPRDVDSAVTRARIVSTARQLFARDGYDSTTNRLIAEASGITSGAIYHYFSSKADLYQAVYAETIDEVYAAFDAGAARRHTLLGQFSEVLDEACALNERDSSFGGFVISVASEIQRHPDLADLVRPLRVRSAMFFPDLVRQAVERGELADDVDPRGLEDLLGAVLGGLARFATNSGDAARHAAAVDMLKRFAAGTLLRPQ